MAMNESVTGANTMRAVKVNLDRAHAAKVKWFDADNGFGWLRIDYIPSDIAINAAALRQAGINPQEINTGDELMVCLFQGKKEERGLYRYSVSRVNTHTPYIHPYPDELPA